MSGFAWGMLAGAMALVILWTAANLWTSRHKHRWTVVCLIGGSMSPGLSTYRGMLDRCRCGRMRWRPDVPLPAWWPADVVMPNEGRRRTEQPGHEDVEGWLHGLPRWGQRTERKLVRQELAMAERDLAEQRRVRHDRSGMGNQ